jgi:hypothetical protein
MPHASRPLILCGIVSLVGYAAAVAAQSFAPQEQALKIIRETAADICSATAVLPQGSSSEAQLSGEAKAKLGGAVAKLADLGIAGAAKYRSSEFSGVLQQQLADVIKKNTDCKLEVFKSLQGILLGTLLIPPRHPAPSPRQPSAQGGGDSMCQLANESQRNTFEQIVADGEPAKVIDAVSAMLECGNPGYRDRVIEAALTNPNRTVRQLGLKAALKDMSSIVIDVHVSSASDARDARFLKEVGATVSASVASYDWRSGRGQISQMSFGYPGGTIAVSGLNLSISNPGAIGCSGTFTLTERDATSLHGTLGCRWGDPYPTYPAEIRIR